MFRNDDMKKISDKDFKKIVTPHVELFDSYMQEFVVPEVCAFYIATGYRLNAIWENNFDTLISTVLSMLTDQDFDMEVIKNNIKKIFIIKYNLKIIEENPLIFEEAHKSAK